MTPQAASGTFQYANPETLHWGPGCLREKLLPELDHAGRRRVFLLTTSSIVRNPELIGAVEKGAQGRIVGRFSAISQHAPVAGIAAAVRAARAAGPDALLSVGGGSPIDAAKAVAFSLATGLDLEDPTALSKARGLRPDAGRVLPHFAVPTTLSVAELSGSAGFSAEGTREKVGVAAPELRPRCVFYDAALALHTPLDLWLSTGIRAVDHAVETLLFPGDHPLPDAAALESLRRLRAALPAARADPRSTAARSEGQIGAWLSYLLPGPAARGLSHSLGKRIGSPHGIPHGVTSCLLLPHVMRFLAPRAAGPLTRIAAVLGAPAPTPAAAADAVAQLVSELGLPRRISAYGLGEADLREAVRPLAGKEYSEAELLGILRAAF